MPHQRSLLIAGTRGIPARHGGFETFAETLAKDLAKKGWRVGVYCQETGSGGEWIESWEGIDRIVIRSPLAGSWGSLLFDWCCCLHAMKSGSTVLVLGYNTAVFNLLLRLAKVPVVMNMDGIEWKREKWSALARLWFRLNEWAGCRIAHHLVADHPEIARHLRRLAPAAKITMIPYGADTKHAKAAALPFGLEPHRYFLVVARPEPENSILTIVRAFSLRTRSNKLVVLGDFDDTRLYHRAVKEAASDGVLFPGAIYDQEVLCSLRSSATLYIHGHQVGGTNPALVEAMAAGCAVIAHDNPFNRWVAATGARYFHDEQSLDSILEGLISDGELLDEMRRSSQLRHLQEFTWPRILGAYEALLTRWQSL